MDPNWTHCPYCAAEAQAESASGQVVEKERNAMRNRTLPGDADDRPGNRRETRVDGDIDRPLDARAEGRRETAANMAKIVAMLISYSRNSGGEIFPIREGRNTIGSGETPDGVPCDILFPEDRKMSAFHAVILYRRGRYEIRDQTSTNGTLVNDDDMDKMELPNYARIQCGLTKFVFIKASLEGGAVESEPIERRPRIREEMIEEVVIKKDVNPLQPRRRTDTVGPPD
jgi:pSer/pThr/pTyr-binding forkhead associated (FHA) protein